MTYFPLTAAQRDIWLDQLRLGDSPLYNIGGYIELTGTVNPALIQRANEHLVAKHDALRTVLQVAADGLPRQAFAEAMVVSVPQHDVSRQPDPRAAAEALLQAQMARAYAMLIGILGCLAGGAISARLFAPKRDVQENVADQSFREQVVADLLKEYGSLGRLEDLSAEVIAELRELELYELFREAQAREENVPVAQAPALTPSLSGGRG